MWCQYDIKRRISARFTEFFSIIMESKSSRLAWFALKAFIAVVIFWLLLRHSQLRLDLCWTMLDSPWSILIIVLACYAMVVLHAWRWYRLNWVQGIDLTFNKTIMPTYLGIAFNTILPGSVGGDFVRLYYVLKMFPKQKSKAVLAIFVDRIVGLIGVFLIACAIAPYYLETFRHDTTLYFLLMVCLGVCVGSFAALVLAMFLLSERFKLIERLATQYPNAAWSRLLVAVLQAVQTYKNAKWVLFDALVVSIITQFLLLVVVVMLSHMMGLPILSSLDYLLALVIGQVANLVPLTPGGVGLGEAAFANVLLLVNPGQSAAYATVFFGLRLLSTAAYLPGVFLGIFGFHLLDKQSQFNVDECATLEYDA